MHQLMVLEGRRLGVMTWDPAVQSLLQLRHERERGSSWEVWRAEWRRRMTKGGRGLLKPRERQCEKERVRGGF